MMTFVEALEKAKKRHLWARPCIPYLVTRGPTSYAGAITWSETRGWVWVPEATGGTPAIIPDLELLKGEWEVVDPKVVLDALHLSDKR